MTRRQGVSVRTRLAHAARRAPRPRGTFSQGVAALAGTAMLAQLITIAVSPILTRLYLPQDLGVLAVYTSALALVGVVSSLRYEYALPLPETDREAGSLLAAGGIALLGVATATAAIVITVGPALAGAVHASGLIPYLWLMPLGVLAAGAYQLLYFWSLRKRAFGAIARTRVTQGLMRSVLQVALGILVVGPLGLLAGQVAGVAGGSLALAGRNGLADPRLLRRLEVGQILRAARRYRRFPLYGGAAGLLNTATLQGLPILLSWSNGIAVAGWFGLMQRLLGLPMAVLGSSISESFLSVAPELARTRPWELKRLFLRIAWRMFVVAVGPVVVVMVAAPTLFPLVFGPYWATSGLYARYWGPALLLQFVVSPLSQLTNVLEQQHTQLALDSTRTALILGVFAAASALDFSASATVLAAGIVMAISYGLYFAVYLRIVSVAARGRPAPNGDT